MKPAEDVEMDQRVTFWEHLLSKFCDITDKDFNEFEIFVLQLICSFWEKGQATTAATAIPTLSTPITKTTILGSKAAAATAAAIMSTTTSAPVTEGVEHIQHNIAIQATAFSTTTTTAIHLCPTNIPGPELPIA